MWKDLFRKTRENHSLSAGDSDTTGPGSALQRQPVDADINRLHVCSRKGLWAMVIFLAASIVAYYLRDQTLTGCLSTSFRAQLGLAPPEFLIDVLQIVSTFSSLILIAGRIYDGREPGNTWMHLGFRLLFYPLYFVSDVMGPHFDFVFVSGLVVLALQHYSYWNYASQAIDSIEESKVMG